MTIYPPANTVIFGVAAETSVLRLAEAAGAPVAHIFEVCEDPSWFGEPFFISQRIAGETLPKRILRLTAADPALGPRIGAKFGRGFAAIHSVPASGHPNRSADPSTWRPRRT